MNPAPASPDGAPAGDPVRRVDTPRGRLAWQVFGAPAGVPVIYCHGFPASRLEARKTHEAATRLGLRVLAIDRPGFGHSAFDPRRTLGDWGDSVRAVADAERIDRFGLVGVSGGGPYALSAAASLGERVTRLVLVCPLGPLADAGSERGMRGAAAALVRLMRRHPTPAQRLYRLFAAPLFRRFPGVVLDILVGSAEAVDRATLDRPEHRAIILDSIREAFRQGARGPAHDLALYTRPWDFDPSTVAAPADLWHGRRDRTVPCRHGEWIAGQLPRCEARYLDREGHFSLPLEHMEHLLQALKG